MPLASRLRPHVRWAAFAVLVALLSTSAVTIMKSRAIARTAPLCGAGLSDDELMAISRQHYGAKYDAPVTESAKAVGATYNVNNYRFDADNNVGTQVDVVHITAGQQVQFHWLAGGGVHTTTSGHPSDIEPGSLWDAPVDAAHVNYFLTLNTPGTYDFFCQYHGEYNNMVGTIIVDAGTPTKAETWGAMKIRYR